MDHVRPNCKAEAETGACKSDSVYMKNIGCDNFCAGMYIRPQMYLLINPIVILCYLKGWGVAYGIASPRRANLVNGFGKCLNGDSLQQSDCDPNENTMLWSWNEVSLGSRDRHICNGHGKCVATPYNSDETALQITYDHLDEHAQRFYLLDSLAHPGFYIIQNDYGKCLSVKGNTNETGAEIWVNHCNPSEAGQHWKWRNLIFTYFQIYLIIIVIYLIY